MADFAYLGQAVYQALKDPRDFCEHYAEIRQGAIAAGLESSLATKAVLELVETKGEFNGTVKALLDDLTDNFKHSETDGWPKSARGLTEILRRQEHALLTFGVKVSFDPVRKKDGYHVKIESIPSPPPKVKGGKDVHHVHHVHQASNYAGFSGEHRMNIGGNGEHRCSPPAPGEHRNVHPDGDVHPNVHRAKPRSCWVGEHCERYEHRSGASTLSEKESIPPTAAEHQEFEL